MSRGVSVCVEMIFRDLPFLDRVDAAVAALLPTPRDEPRVEIAAWTRRVDPPLDEPEWDIVAQVLAGYDHSPRTGDRPYYVTGVASERFERDWAETMPARRVGDVLVEACLDLLHGLKE